MVHLVKTLYEIPVPSTGFLVSETYVLLGTIRFCYERDGSNYKSGLRFNKVYASRRASERTAKVWHIESAYDRLVEVENSSWAKELTEETADMQRRFNEKWDMHHYLIYLDSFGSFEAVAESWDLLPEEPGLWPDPMKL